VELGFEFVIVGSVKEIHQCIV